MLRTAFQLLHGRAATTSAVAAASHGRHTKRGPSATPTPSATLAATAAAVPFTTAKAGMEFVDADRVARVVAEAARHSRFHHRERERAAERSTRHAALASRAARYRAGRVPESVRAACQREARALQRRLASEHSDFSRRYVHIDMDMYYAAVEELRDPSLRTVPFAVGTNAMLTTSNYLARRYGVRSGMPGFLGRRLCPELRIVPPDFATYRAVAARVRRLARRVDPAFVSVGLDELTMDVTDYLARHPGATAASVCSELRAAVQARTGLTCSGGIASSAALAKMASNRRKPNGQFEECVGSRAEAARFVRRLPVRAVPGIGPAQEALLAALDITECGQLRRAADLICFLFPTAPRTREMLVGAGIGVLTTYADKVWAQGRRTPAARRLPRSLGRSATLPPAEARRVTTERAAWRALRPLALQAHEALREAGCAARTVEFVVKNTSFDAYTAQVTLPAATSDFKQLWGATRNAARTVLAPELGRVRLLGVRFAGLEADAETSKAGKKLKKTRAAINALILAQGYEK